VGSVTATPLQITAEQQGDRMWTMHLAKLHARSWWYLSGSPWQTIRRHRVQLLLVY